MENLEVVKYIRENEKNILNFKYNNLNQSLFAGGFFKPNKIENVDQSIIEDLVDFIQSIDKNINFGVREDMPIEQKVWTQCRNILSILELDPKYRYILHLINDFAINANANKNENECIELIKEKFNIKEELDINNKLKKIYHSLNINSQYCKTYDGYSRELGTLNYLRSL